MKGMIKAAVFHGVNHITTENLPIPECPEDGLLIKVYACGICGSDVRNYYHNGLKDGIQHQIMGHEIAGEVVETGLNAKRFRVGDRVALAPDISCGSCWYCKRGLVNLCESHKMLGTHFPGGYAQYMAVPKEVLEHGFIEKIPDDMPFQHAAFAETASAVIACQKRINVSMGDSVLIIGDGPVGCLHTEVARARGADTVMVAGMDKLELAKEFHPDYLWDNHDPEKVRQGVMDATGGIGADFVIIAAPTTAPQKQALELVRKRGTVVIYGGAPSSADITSVSSNRIHYGEITLTGSFSYPAVGLHDALSAIYHQKIHADQYLGEKVSLENVVHGMELITQGKALKVMIDPWLS